MGRILFALTWKIRSSRRIARGFASSVTASRPGGDGELSMKIPLAVWQSEVARVGERWARINLRYISRPVTRLLYTREQWGEHRVLYELAHWPGASPMVNRKRFASIFRGALRQIREKRLRLAQGKHVCEHAAC